MMANKLVLIGNTLVDHPPLKCLDVSASCVITPMDILNGIIWITLANHISQSESVRLGYYFYCLLRTESITKKQMDK